MLVFVFVVCYFGVDVGVMVIVLYNLLNDNGYKVYFGGVD